MAISKTSKEYLQSLGDVQYKTGNYTAAVISYKAAITAGATDIYVYSRVGNMLGRAGDPTQARSFIRQAAIASDWSTADRFSFTDGNFLASIPMLTTELAALQGVANLKYIEVGPYEGMSLQWFLDNIAGTNATATVIGSPFGAGSTYSSNLSETRVDATVVNIPESSQDIKGLPAQTSNNFDVVRLDGITSTRTADIVFQDLVDALRIVKINGFIIIDDMTKPKLRDAVYQFLQLANTQVSLMNSAFQAVIKRLS